MKKVDLSNLSYTRLQKYRKSLTDKCHRYETCWCGISGCEFNNEENKNNSYYLELKVELDSVLVECSRRNKIIVAEQKRKNWAHVPTVKENL